MGNLPNEWNTFYQKLGYLFYAVAASDHQISVAEIETLKQCVRKHWLKVDSTIDEFDTDAAFQIEIVFDWLVNEIYDPLKAFEEFEEFFKTHKSFKKPQVRKLISDTCFLIANSFYGVNKNEKQILDKTARLLQ